MPPSTSLPLAPQRTAAWLRTFLPMPIAASRRERIKSCAGALLGLFCTEWISRHLLAGFNPWFVAPMGASAVLLFAVPSSPLAQPWSIIGGNLVAALVGVACAQWMPAPGLAAGVAVAVAIALMFQLRCIHPPSGAVAITAVFGGPAVRALGFGFVVMPVLVNSMLLLLLALVFNNLARRRYPHRPPEAAPGHGTADPPPAQRAGITRADLDQALAERGEFLDIEEDDLEAILIAAEQHAYRRRFGELRCADIMSRDVVAVQPGQALEDAWDLLARHRIKALPVVDEQRRLRGMLSATDHLLGRDAAGPRQRVADRMTPAVLTARPDQPMIELAQAFCDGGLHHVPVVDAGGIVVGMVTQSDLMAALLKDSLLGAGR